MKDEIPATALCLAVLAGFIIGYCIGSRIAWNTGGTPYSYSGIIYK